MILCITPNPAIDRTLIVPYLQPGEVQRAIKTIVAAGGKGLNAARAMRTLGADPLCMGFLGGHSGRLLAELADHEGLRTRWTWIDRETRTCVIVVEEDNCQASVINESGPTVTAEAWAALSTDVLQQSVVASLVCVAGSLPPGSPRESFTELLLKLGEAGKRVWVDTSGAALTAALMAAGVNIKVNGEEAGLILNQQVDTLAAASRAATDLRKRGANQVAITLGKLGALLVTNDGAWHSQPPPVQALSAVGSGDAFLAGLITALDSGSSPADALHRASAAGTANALSPGGGRFTLKEFEQALNATRVSRLE